MIRGAQAALLSVLAGCSEAGRASDANCSDDPGASPSDVCPFVVHSSPELDAQNVYPSPFGDGQGFVFRIDVAFSVPMNTGVENASFGAHDEPPTEHALRWDGSGFELTVLIRPKGLETRVLRDFTEYRLDLSTLESAEGIPLSRSRGLHDGALWFSTSSYDPLLNHSCGHTVFGPFGGGAAGSEHGEGLVISATHTQYEIQLPANGDVFTGFVTLRSFPQGSYRLYFDAPPVLARYTGTSEQTLHVEAAPESCAGIRAQADLELTSDHDVVLELGSDAPTLQLIVEALVK